MDKITKCIQQKKEDNPEECITYVIKICNLSSMAKISVAREILADTSDIKADRWKDRHWIDEKVKENVWEKSFKIVIKKFNDTPKVNPLMKPDNIDPTYCKR